MRWPTVTTEDVFASHALYTLGNRRKPGANLVFGGNASDIGLFSGKDKVADFKAPTKAGQVFRIAVIRATKKIKIELFDDGDFSKAPLDSAEMDFPQMEGKKMSVAVNAAHTNWSFSLL